MSEFVKLGDTFRFGVVTHNPSGGALKTADELPRWSVFEDSSDTPILEGAFTLRSGFIGTYRSTFNATLGNGFNSTGFYEVHASGKVDSIVGRAIIKSFVLDDIYNANMVQISGANLPGAFVDSNVKYISDDATAADNLELQYDTTGLTGNTFPARQDAATTPSGVAFAVWDEVLSKSAHDVAQSAGKRLRQLASVVIEQETAQGPGTGNNQIQLHAGASSTDGDYDPSLIFIEAGTGTGQSRNILAYDGTSKTATVDRNWRQNPDSTSEFIILADAGREHVNEGLAQSGTLNTITLNTLAASSNDIYNGQIVFIRAGTGEDQVGTVISYVGSSKVATVHRNWAVIPDTTSAYVMLPASPVELTDNSIGGIWDEARSGHVAVGSFGEHVNANITQISDDTTAAQNLELQYDGTGLTGNTFPARQDTVVTVSGVANATASDVWDEILTGSSHNITNSAGKRLRQIGSFVVRNEMAQSGTLNTIMLDAGASSVDGTFDPSLISLIDGTGAGQTRLIYEYDGTSKVAVVDRNWKVIPDITTEFIITGNAGREHVNEGLFQGGSINTATLNALASSTDDIYKGQHIFIRSGTGDDQVREVIDYNGTTKVATVFPDWDVTPNTTSAYAMLPIFRPTTLLRKSNVQAGTTDSITLDSSASSTDDFYNFTRINISTGTGAGQSRVIADYNGTTKVATITPSWTISPDSSSQFIIEGGSVHASTQDGGYDNASVWVDTADGTAGTQQYVNGTTTRPVNNLADAFVIASGLNLHVFHIFPNSDIILTADSSDREFVGEKYDLELNGQDIGGSVFRGCNVAGTGVASVGRPAFFLCGIGNVTLPPCDGFQNGFFGTFTMGSSGDFTFGGSSEVFDSSLTLDYGAGLSASHFFLTSWGGGNVEIQNAGAGAGAYTFEMNGVGQLTVNANCSADTTVTLRGNINRNADVAGVVYVEDANVIESSVVDAVWDEPTAGHTTINTFGAALQPIYYADIKYIKDVSNSNDEYSVCWFKDGTTVASGSITNPAISVYNTLTGASLFVNQTLDYASTALGVLRHDSTLLTPSGEPFLVSVSGTIDSATREWKKIVGLDDIF